MRLLSNRKVFRLCLLLACAMVCMAVYLVSQSRVEAPDVLQIYNNHLPQIYNNHLPQVYNSHLPQVYNNHLPQVYNSHLPQVYNSHLPQVYNSHLPQVYNSHLPQVYNSNRQATVTGAQSAAIFPQAPPANQHVAEFNATDLGAVSRFTHLMSQHKTTPYNHPSPRTTKTHPKGTKKPILKKTPKPLLYPPPVRSLPPQLPVRYLVYLCDSESLCGGWGDRQRGIVSVYILSRLINRQFRIVMQTPCNLSFFYRPNQVPWEPAVGELDATDSTTFNTIGVDAAVIDIVNTDLITRLNQKVIYIKANTDFYDRLKLNPLFAGELIKWTGIAVRKHRFRWAWQDLMQPTPLLLRHLEHILGSKFLFKKGLKANTSSLTNSTYDVGDSPLVCGHARMGKNPSIPMDEYKDGFRMTDIPVLFNFMLSKDKQSNAYFFVAADYENIRVQSRQFFGQRLIDYGGKILHIDRQRKDHTACAGFESAILDQLILSLCDVLVICMSGFSKHASYISNSTQPIYMVHHGEILQYKG
ncbi:uncharacterized protein LOC131935116 [Physella acuta]|uniref:uncharacterized protein LOC131935116 n=1 Tax=Physella acuta TaxID=109671 RepID=UPI0027DD2C98|nr:uncharacterized protein LOC131935116 [Physella acuta]XP_059147434.1 uncharacterized protein LOC131935116 [Physella acuta]XP_059147435.1 uncharacterized protein LOC131935116 [Physella acuta]